MLPPMLEIRGLCRDFAGGRVLDNVDLAVRAGEVRGIAGESGSGKTTLARCALRLLEPTLGSVRFDGQDLAELAPSALRAKRREFQMVFQDPLLALDPLLSVEEILSEPLEIHRDGSKESRAQRVRELADSVGLGACLLPRRPSELSGGQQQRVGIARALTTRPRLLVADEPVSSLDASVQVQILNLLGELKARHGLTLVLISHSLSCIHYLSTDVSVLYRGRIVEEAPADAFFRDPLHPYSRALLSGTDPDSPAPRASAGCPFGPNCREAGPLCRDTLPPLAPHGPDRRVACFARKPPG